MPLNMKAQSGEEINVNDTVELRDGTFARVKGETTDLLHHTGGFTPAKDVLRVDHRYNPKDYDRAGYLGIVARSGEAVKVGDVVVLTDETLTTVKGQTGDLMEHTGGFCTSDKVLKVNYRPPTPKTCGMSVSVYRNADPFFTYCNASCTVTGKYHTVLLISEDGKGPISVEDWLKTNQPGSVMRVVRKDGRTYAVPGHVEGDGTGRWANNGNFLYSTDSRFTALFNGLPIMAHDYDMSAERR